MIVSSPEERGISVETAANVSRQQQRLHIWHQPERDAFLQVRVFDLVLLAQLPGGDDQLARGIVHLNTAAVLVHEPRTLYLPTVDERQHQTVGQHGAQFLHQVKSKAGTPGPVRMKEAHRRIETDRLQSGFDVMADRKSVV